MMNDKAFDYHCKELLRIGKKQATLELMQRVRKQCLGLDASGWALRTGVIFGEYLKELERRDTLPL